MKKNEFIKKIAERAGTTQIDARAFLSAIEDVTMELMSKNDYAPFEFGRIGGKDVAARTARNPKTGETISVPAKTGYPYAKFSSSAKAQD